METTPLGISIVIFAVILFFVARIILKRDKEAEQLEEKLNAEDGFSLSQESDGSDVFEEPVEQRIILDGEIESYSDVKEKELAQVGEKRYVAVLSVSELSSDETVQENIAKKQIMGIIECNHSLGNGRVKPYQFDEDMRDSSAPLSDTKIRIGKNVLFPYGYTDTSNIEVLCNEIDKFNKDFVAFIDGKTVYIRINRHATLTDLKTMIEILMNYQY